MSVVNCVSLSGGTLGLIMAAGCVGMAASSLMELQNNGGYFLHHVIFASFAVLSVLCIMLLPESKNKPLPDSLKDGERQRRPPLFLSRMNLDNPPLLRMQPHSSEYNRDNYSRLVTATKRCSPKMLCHTRSPFRHKRLYWPVMALLQTPMTTRPSISPKLFLTHRTSSHSMANLATASFPREDVVLVFKMWSMLSI